MLFARVEFHAIREDIPETYCGLTAPDSLESFTEGQVDQVTGPFCVRCSIIIGHNWQGINMTDPKAKLHHQCSRCGTSSRVATKGKDDRCPVKSDRAVLSNQEDQAVIPDDKKEQWESQIERLDRMISGAATEKEKARYESWKAELQARLDGKPLPTQKTSRGSDETYDRRSLRVLDWLKDHDGEKVDWKEFFTGTKMTSAKLGKVVGQMIKENRLKEDPQYCYHIVEGGTDEETKVDAVEPETSEKSEEPAVDAPPKSEDSKAPAPEPVTESKPKTKPADDLDDLEQGSLFGED